VVGCRWGRVATNLRLLVVAGRLSWQVRKKGDVEVWGFCLYNVPQHDCGVYTLGCDAIPELKSRRNQLNQEGSP